VVFISFLRKSVFGENMPKTKSRDIQIRDKDREVEGTFSQVPNETSQIAKNVVDYQRSERKNLKELVNKVVYIVNAKVINTSKGYMGIVEAYEKLGDRIQEYYTFSKVIIKELDRLMPLLEKGYVIRVKISQDTSKGYLYFDSPR
jgi:hypothetical protein